jgi:peptide/nickel transport system substrate-binding protein
MVPSASRSSSPSSSRLCSAVLAIGLAVAASAAGAQTLRWSSQGDPQTLDPYSQNEGLTNMWNGQIYEFLVARDRKLGLVPQLATEWTQETPLKWVFKLRRGVVFHDGRPFTADDVVFSMKRAKEKTSQIAVYANAMGEAKKIDDYTVEFDQKDFDPIFLQHLNTLYIMSKGWCEEHQATRPQDFTNHEEAYVALHANGTGPYMLESRQPDVRSVLKRNPRYWGPIEGNVQEVVYTPIREAGTRVAALVSGQLDFVLDPPPAYLDRLRHSPGLQVIDGPENRIMFVGMDQARDELLYGGPKGRNPLKDVRVRRALYQSIDIEQIKAKVMNGQAVITGAVVPTTLADFDDPEVEKRLPLDVSGAKRLLAEAGYPGGFEVTLDCPNNRYVNDEKICLTLAQMWSRIGVKVTVNAMPKVNFFPKLERLDTSMYLMGWGGSITDAESIFTPVWRNRGTGGPGSYNYGNYKDDTLQAILEASSKEPDVAKRKALIKQAFLREEDQVHYIPLHRQTIPWAARDGVSVVHRADNWLEIRWVTVK